MAGHDRITPEGKKFFEQIEELKKLQVRVGYQQDAAKSGVDMVEIAMRNELGTDTIPSRPFLRESADMNRDTIEKFCKAQVQGVAKGKTAQEVLNAVGSMQKGLIQETIAKSKDWATPNAPYTIHQKKSDQPLVDTGRMAQSVNYVIKEKGDKN